MTPVRCLIGSAALIVLHAVLYSGCSRETEPESLPEALALAAQTKKPVLVDFYTDDCGFCKVFAREAATDPDVRSALSDVVLCSVDADTEDGASLMEEHAVRAWPTFVLLNDRGQPLGSWV